MKAKLNDGIIGKKLHAYSICRHHKNANKTIKSNQYVVDCIIALLMTALDIYAVHTGIACIIKIVIE